MEVASFSRILYLLFTSWVVTGSGCYDCWNYVNNAFSLLNFSCSFMNFTKRTVCRECGKAKNRTQLFIFYLHFIERLFFIFVVAGAYDDVNAASKNEENKCLQIEISLVEQDEIKTVLEQVWDRSVIRTSVEISFSKLHYF